MKAGGEGDNGGRDGWMAYHRLRHEFEQAPGVGEGQGRLQSMESQKSDMTEWLDWTELNRTRSDSQIHNYTGDFNTCGSVIGTTNKQDISKD